MSDRQASPAAGETLAPGERLRSRAEFQRCYKTGRRRHGALAILYSAPNQLGHPRIGITVTRKVGKAVVRNRLRRRIREVYRRCIERRKLPALDLVVHLRPSAGDSDFETLKQDLLRLFRPLEKSGRAAS